MRGSVTTTFPSTTQLCILLDSSLEPTYRASHFNGQHKVWLGMLLMCTVQDFVTWEILAFSRFFFKLLLNLKHTYELLIPYDFPQILLSKIYF